MMANAHAIILLQCLHCQFGSHSRTLSVPYVLWQMAIVHLPRIILAFVHLHESYSQ